MAARKMTYGSDVRQIRVMPDHHQVFSAATLGSRGVRLHSTPDRRTEVRFIGDA